LPRAVEVEIPTVKDMRRFKEDFMRPFKQYPCEDKEAFEASKSIKATGFLEGGTADETLDVLQKLLDSQTILKGYPGTFKVNNVRPTKKGGVLVIIVSRSGAEALQKVDWTIRLSSAGLVKFIPEDDVEEVTLDEDTEMKEADAKDKTQELSEEVSRLRVLLGIAESKKVKAEEEAAEARLRAMNVVDDDVVYLKTEPAKEPLPAIVKQEPVDTDTNTPSVSGAGASSWADEMERVDNDKGKDAGDKVKDRSLAAILQAANDDPAVKACRDKLLK